ncbi:MAG: hypothetical protein FWE23_11050 [Chitinivibrionia bacterium]|nr:hypothetical protein [Chitinivibrionia bacterium]
MTNQLKSIVVILAIFATTSFAVTIGLVQPRDWAAGTAEDGEIIRVSATSTGTLSVPNGATVTIISDGTETVNLTSRPAASALNPRLAVSIAEGATVRWQARVFYNSSVSSLAVGREADASTLAVRFSGAGNFRVYDEAVIRNQGWIGNAIRVSGNGTVDVLGGVIDAFTRDVVINSLNNANIIIRGGDIHASTWQGIAIAASNVNVSGGIIRGGGSAQTRIIRAGTITVSGGEIRATGLAEAINVTEHAVISGGEITASGGAHTINLLAGAELEVREGAVIRQTLTEDPGFIGPVHAINLTSPNRVSVLGGEISAASTGAAIRSADLSSSNIITISGGVISATRGNAIIGSGNGQINIRGGLIVAQGTNVVGATNVLDRNPTSRTGGVLVAYPVSGNFMPGSSNGLATLPLNANVSWANQNGQTGILVNGSQFFATTGTQEVVTARDWTTTALTAADGQTIRITSSEALGTLTIPNNATVTIISDGAEPIARTTRLDVSIGDNATVIWRARISTSGNSDAVSFSSGNNSRIEIHEGAIIRQTQSGSWATRAISTGAGRITVYGGEVSVVGTGTAINFSGSAASNTITINGGIISAPNGRAINIGGGGTINKNGGEIIQVPNPTWGTSDLTAFDGEVITIPNNTSQGWSGRLSVPVGATITVVSEGNGVISRAAEFNVRIGAGATVNWDAKTSISTSGTSSPNAVSVGGTGTLEVRDGAIIRATSGQAISSETGTIVNIRGGLIIATGFGIVGTTSHVINRAPTSQTGGIVIAYPSTAAIRIAGTSDGLLSLPENARISWGINDGNSCVLLDGNYLFTPSNAQRVWNWDGTTINNASDLAFFRDLVNAGNNFSGETILLGANINVSGTWTAIGTAARPFRGVFNGQGRSISGLSSPLFGNITGAEIRNLTINNSHGLLNNADGSLIENVRVNISATSVVGLAATTSGGDITIRNSLVSGNISASATGNNSVNLGGLINDANSVVIIENSSFEGNITANAATASSVVGGLVGRAQQDITIKNSSASGDIRSTVSGTTAASIALAGGLIGRANITVGITESYFSGEVLTTLSSTMTTANLSHTARSGGFIGYASGILGVGAVNISNSFVLADVLASNASLGQSSGFTYSGGFIGTLRNRINITNSYVNGEIIASGVSAARRRVGGIVGFWSASNIESNVFSSLPCQSVDIAGTSAAQLRNRATFTDWDFENIWNINPTTNNGFPFLRNAGADDTVGSTFIRSRPDTQPRRHGILLENAIVSDIAKITVITPEPAQTTLRILDNLGNTVFVETRHALSNNNEFTWNLQNQARRFVANGTYLVLVEATGISGRRFVYSSRIGVKR